MIEKRCAKCKLYLAQDKFYKNKYGKYGLTSRCKQCFQQSSQHKLNLLAADSAELDIILTKKCAVCKNQVDGFNKNGNDYLCNKCSSLLRTADNDTEHLSKVLNYLSRGKDKVIKSIKIIVKEGFSVKEVTHTLPSSFYREMAYWLFTKRMKE
jgi:hypothetical protein